LETHSDHVLNGIRRAIGEYHYLSHESAVTYFFEVAGNDPPVEQLEFNAIGGTNNWPKGFFDQYQIDVASLGRIRRRG
jgi:predicted ATPase